LQLRNGQLVTVPPNLVRRLKSHFVALPCGVDLILGLNGYIWVSKPVKENEQEGEEGFDAEAVYSNQNDVSLTAPRKCSQVWVIPIIASSQEIDASTRNAIARVSNIIRILASHCIPLTDTILLEAYDWAIEQESDVNDLLQDDFGSALVVAVGGLGSH